jgi:hypothetical protein
MLSFENHTLGVNDEKIAIESSGDHRLAALRMAQQAKSNIAIISRELDPPVYNTPEFVEAVKQLVLANRHTHLRAMVFEPQIIMKYGHRLVDMMLDLTSFIEFRVPSYEYDDFDESLFVADETGYILRTSAERYEGHVNFNDKRSARILMKKFEEMWEKAKPDPNLKRVIL